jgi:hypothetical protein
LVADYDGCDLSSRRKAYSHQSLLRTSPVERVERVKRVERIERRVRGVRRREGEREIGGRWAGLYRDRTIRVRKND